MVCVRIRALWGDNKVLWQQENLQFCQDWGTLIEHSEILIEHDIITGNEIP